MRRSSNFAIPLVTAITLLAFAGCKRPAPPPAETPVPEAPAPATPAAQAPAVSAAEPQPAASAGPVISSMTLAAPPQKLGAPVDLRYQFDGEVKAGQPVTLHLAAVPRVAGSNLTMSIKNESGISAKASALNVQKANVSTAYRQDVSVTKLDGGPSELQVLVTMEVPEGSAHSWFTIPLGVAPAAGKQQGIKLQ
jgi:hypothetical protein